MMRGTALAGRDTGSASDGPSTGDPATMRLFAYHENPESVAALLDALAQRVEVHAFRVVSPLAFVGARRRRGAFYWAEVADADHQDLALVPGLRRSQRLSARMLQRSYRSAVARFGEPDFLLVDSPYLAPWATTLDVPLAYVATDAYRHYAWPVHETEAFERKLFAHARASFPVSELLAEEFEAAGARTVVRLPNGVSAGFAERANGSVPIPLDIAGIPGPRVVVVGVINATYDWDLIESFAEARPDVSFVFIGPIHERNKQDRARIDQAFARANIHGLGPRPRDELPSYLSAGDVLLNPLAVNDHNDRRYPLRLCEYLTTDRSILSTSIHEAKWFAPHVVTFEDGAAGLAALDSALAGGVAVDAAGRREWLERSSWDARATQVLEALRTVATGR